MIYSDYLLLLSWRPFFFNCVESIVNLISDMPMCEIRWFKTSLYSILLNLWLCGCNVLWNSDWYWAYVIEVGGISSIIVLHLIMFGREEKHVYLMWKICRFISWANYKSLRIFCIEIHKFVELYIICKYCLQFKN